MSFRQAAATKKKCCLFIIASLIFWPVMVNAEPKIKKNPEEMLTYEYFFQVFMSLILVLVIILFLAWLLRRITNHHVSHGKGMSILSTLAIGTREKIVLLSVGDKQILVGVTAGKIEHLYTFEQPVLPSETMGVSNVSDFADNMQEAMHIREKIK